MKKTSTPVSESPQYKAVAALLLSLPPQPFMDLDCFPGDLGYDPNLKVLTLEEILRLPPTIRVAPAPVAPASAKSTTGRTTKISIRVPSSVLAAFKARAETSGVKYQRLLNLELQAAVLRGFVPLPISKPAG